MSISLETEIYCTILWNKKYIYFNYYLFSTIVLSGNIVDINHCNFFIPLKSIILIVGSTMAANLFL